MLGDSKPKFVCAIISGRLYGRWRTPEGIALGGAGYFGYEVGYVPVEGSEWVRGVTAVPHVTAPPPNLFHLFLSSCSPTF